MKFIQIIAALLVIQVALASARNAYFVFSDGTDEFTIKLTDPAKIAHARGLISGAVTDAPHINGIIVKQPAWYNPFWSFYLDSNTISFFDAAMEVCDAGINYTEEHLAEVGGALLPGNRWCPWHSRVVREV
ncbi:hypothetical protein SAMD00019534_047680 [Acytostelium subglobosum LB1]|uniref:hypothetical protein n=1 Tax=Acytostelium subglobosum LB1 TaxID=1410327 RepID=UPI000644D546|nr:hypothetical protein SAMD00019534_047680 [Acytostelium subglobosum LB1]GAM21593.1 hypothetical protein SAMD00019534_047680 [Acytostelium subglobosum LB1]|eukprot:XP_012755712.1 hypothetical protein SAMD00019534_047680 [Acytostelium subglobosum LB1]